LSFGKGDSREKYTKPGVPLLTKGKSVTRKIVDSKIGCRRMIDNCNMAGE
jgi:hypothetical protein